MADKEFVEWTGRPFTYVHGEGAYGVLVGKRFYEFSPTGHLSNMGKITKELLAEVTGRSEASQGFSAAGAAIRQNMAARPQTEEDNGKQRQRRIRPSRQTRADAPGRE